MTGFTPECLAQTDFPRLARDNPSLARECLEALVANPEALALYEEELSSKDSTCGRLMDHPGWDELRRRIRRGGLGPSILDDEILARLAQDFDALAELQFDLFSTETPAAPWRRALATESIASDYIGSSGEARPAHYKILEETSRVPSMRDDAEDVKDVTEVVEAHPETVAAPCDSPSRKSSVVDAKVIFGGYGTRAQSAGPPNLQRCLIDHHSWPSWSSHRIDYQVNSFSVIILLNHDSSANSCLTPPNDGLDGNWPHYSLASIYLDLLRSHSSPEFLEDGPQCRQLRHICRSKRSSWPRWLQKRVPSLDPRNGQGNGLEYVCFEEFVNFVSGSLLTFFMDWSKERAEAIDIPSDGSTVSAIDAITRQGKSIAVSGICHDLGIGNHVRGQSTRRRRAFPTPSGRFRGELVDSV